MKYTVVGGKGFIGNTIVRYLEKGSEQVWVPEKNDASLFDVDLGTVIYCAGHGDCVNNPFKVLESNTILLSNILESASFDRLIYLSSTRVYMDQAESNEDSFLTISSRDSRRLFNLTKLVSEELLLKSQKDVVIVRPSNVYGLALNSPLFLPSIVKNAINTGQVDMYVSPEYAKDYVSVYDVSEITILLAKDKSTIGGIYNIASGVNITAQDISEVLKQETQCKIIWHENNVQESFPVTRIDKIVDTYAYKPRSVLTDLVSMIASFTASLGK
ncbi:MAG: nucleoside-diphosphate-sugar epimerase [Oleiphilaceae bacterium]|jgi:nucleoside-diphosphate-sugar epimerase